MREALAKFADWLKRENGFTLIAHVSPDGDTLGSSFALFAILNAMNKDVQLICEQTLPSVYAFLPNADKMLSVEDAYQSYANAIAVDCADEERMGLAKPLFLKAAHKGNIDHHLTNTGFGEFILHCEKAAATAELIYILWQELGVAKSEQTAQDIAICLYTGINTDTGNFAYSNTTPETFRMAAGLLAYGIDISNINRLLYRTVPLRKAKLLGHVLDTLQLYENGKLGIATILLEDMQRTGAKQDDVEGMIDFVRDIETVEIAIVIRESVDGSYKISLRSKQSADVCKIAEKFAGGGHLRAAGCTMRGDLTLIFQNLLQTAREALL